jgi:hypothetical protein
MEPVTLEVYYLFAGSSYYPGGGAHDFRGTFGSVQDAKNAIYDCDWAHVAQPRPDGRLLILAEYPDIHADSPGRWTR